MSALTRGFEAWPQSTFSGPRIIGHRGACHHATENTLPAFNIASDLGADMWELDARVSADGVCVISHDDLLSTVFAVEGKISELSYAEIRRLTDGRLPSLADVIALAQTRGAGLYVELKDAGAGLAALEELRRHEVSYAALGSFETSWVKALAERGCEYPLAVLVPLGADPFLMAQQGAAQIIHLCWERAGDSPQQLVTPDLLARARANRLEVVLWHEERPKVIKALLKLPVAGICSDRPELFVPYPGSPARTLVSALRTQVVCHRGAEHIAPENTLAAFERVFEQGFDWAEIDVQETRDGQLVVLHDETLERTTNGAGAIAQCDWEEARTLDAGCFFDPHYAGERMPLLSEVIELAKRYQKSLYIELKGADAAKVLEQVKAQHFLVDCFFWSFDHAKLERIRELDVNANIMLRSQDFPSVREARDSLAASVIEIEVSSPNLEREIADTRDLGCSVMLCYQGSDRAVFERIVGLKPDLLNLNRADLWKRALFAASSN
ncbi:MAG: glycerophosphodiester phosphodiesterase [Pseudomonadales bacterium]